MVRGLKILVLCGLCSLFMSCGPKVLFEDDKLFESTHWNYGNDAIFDFEISEVEQKYDLELILNHNDSYSFENLYVKIHTTFPNGETIADQLSIPLANQFGIWIAPCSGNSCELKVKLQDDIKFKEVGKYQIRFEQFTRTENLQGIEAVKFRILEANG